MSEPTLKERLKDLETNPTLISYYIKKGCKRCLGKGIITHSLRDGLGWTERKVFCECVRKNLREEMKANG